MQDCRDAQSRDSKEFAAFFNEGNVQVHLLHTRHKRGSGLCLKHAQLRVPNLARGMLVLRPRWVSESIRAAQARKGEFSSALAAYSRAADLAPGIAGYRLRQAEMLFQNNRAHDADVMMRGIVRKNPSYAGRPTSTCCIRLKVPASACLTPVHMTHGRLVSSSMIYWMKDEIATGHSSAEA